MWFAQCIQWKKATTLQSEDLLHFREYGERDYLNYVRSRILQESVSSDAPVRKRKLRTMADSKTAKKAVSTKDKELKQVTKCLKRRLAWCNSTGQQYNPNTEQYSLLPRAICDYNGLPNKCLWTHKLKNLKTRIHSFLQGYTYRCGCQYVLA